MSDHLREDRIHDYVDDLLCHEERAEAERHLLTCTQCQREVAALRDLLTDLHDMPDVHPERELLTDINARIDAAPMHASAGGLLPGKPVAIGDRSLRSLRYPLAAAALVLIALSASLTVALFDRGNSANAGRNIAGGETSAAGGRNVLASSPRNPTPVDQHYGVAAAELEELLAEQRANLSPETVRLVEDNLRVIDTALAEARAALREDPGNAALSDLVRSAYEKKIDLLRHATHVRGDT
jgi:hypothetical protein